MKKSELSDAYHGKWLAVRWEDWEVLYIGTSIEEVTKWIDSRFPENKKSGGIILDRLIKQKYEDPFPQEVRRAVEKFRKQISKQRERWLMQTLDKYYPKPPPVPRMEKNK